jgi:hypothetical protein
MTARWNLFLGSYIALMVWLLKSDPTAVIACTGGWFMGYVVWRAVKGEPRRPPPNDPPKLR